MAEEEFAEYSTAAARAAAIAATAWKKQGQVEGVGVRILGMEVGRPSRGIMSLMNPQTQIKTLKLSAVSECDTRFRNNANFATAH